ncbi:12481_t:CDS:1, partial [Entrophospora sp. SA101]
LVGDWLSMMSSEELNHNFKGEEEFLNGNETTYVEDSVSNI